MRLYFLRHADALSGMDDESRPLSPQGRRESKAIGLFLKKTGVRFDVACSSPLSRARETAEIVLDLCGMAGKAKLEVDDALRNETPQDIFDRWLGGLKSVNHVLLVGHAPVLADRVRKLLKLTNSDVLSLPKAGMACLETMDRRQADLVFFISPGMLPGVE